MKIKESTKLPNAQNTYAISKESITLGSKKKKFFVILSLISLFLLFLIMTIFFYIFQYTDINNMKHVSTINKKEITDVSSGVNKLQRGVDISLWFRFPLDESDKYFANYITDDDLSLIKNNGFTHVRLSIAPQYIFDATTLTKINTHMLPFIDKAIERILSHHIAVVVDVHDEQKTFENQKNAQDFLVFWRNFSNHLTKFDTNNVYFELLNEPVFDGKEQEWLKLQNQLIQTVRQQAPDNTIIAIGANWGGIEGLENVKPSTDKNIIYSFHFYEPMAFTHQGADWGGDSYPSIANLEYPENPSNCEQVLAKVTTDNARDEVQGYCDQGWNKETLAKFIQRAVDWSKKNNNVPIWVGEFGVYCKQTPRQSKLQWLKDVKYIFEQNHIGWTLWGYDDCFGLGVTHQDGHITYDNDVLQIFGNKQMANTPSISPIISPTSQTNWSSLIGSSWQWQLDGDVDTSVDAKVFDIDYEKNDMAVVNTLHAKGSKVICYISMGSWENWRGDASQFPQSVIGKDYTNWSGEKWLDIRQLSIIGPILQKRLDMCQQKGFDAVEPDNIHGYQEDTGFSLTYDDQLTFNKWVSQEAHKRGLLIGLKNDSEQVHDLLPYFDFAITEDCFQQGWCSDMTPFIYSDKPVFASEYTDTGMTTDKFCPQAKQLQFSGILKNRKLDAYTHACN